jgi:hypothetical protein
VLGAGDGRRNVIHREEDISAFCQPDAHSLRERKVLRLDLA